MDKYKNSIILAIVILYLVAWTKTFEDELSYNNNNNNAEEDEVIKSTWSVSMLLVANLMQSLLLLVLGFFVLKLLNIIHFKWILDAPESFEKAQLNEVFKSLSMVLKQSVFILLSPLIISLILTSTIDWIMTVFIGVGMEPITVLLCNLVFTMISFVF